MSEELFANPTVNSRSLLKLLSHAGWGACSCGQLGLGSPGALTAM